MTIEEKYFVYLKVRKFIKCPDFISKYLLDLFLANKDMAFGVHSLTSVF